MPSCHLAPAVLLPSCAHCPPAHDLTFSHPPAVLCVLSHLPVITHVLPLFRMCYHTHLLLHVELHGYG
ncbi:hypothetical protein BDR04DRAFT_1098312 [Suillus decipiens]|nr:hypothetical protein BDR04DRAFT_1098312 [Suillus decipiens]